MESALTVLSLRSWIGRFNGYLPLGGCEIEGCSDIPAGDCDCNGNVLTSAASVAALHPTGDCDCDGNVVDECGICGGAGITQGYCDCDGNQLDALGVCGGPCEADADADGICDDVDSCLGELDVLGECGGGCLLDSDGDGICDWTASEYFSPCQGESTLSYQGHEYDLVEIGGHCWFAENLQAESFNDGTPIHRLDGSIGWVNESGSGPAYCAFNGNEILSDSMGFLYNWFVANHEKNICPVGWEVPALFNEWGWPCLFNQYGPNASESLRSDLVSSLP